MSCIPWRRRRIVELCPSFPLPAKAFQVVTAGLALTLLLAPMLNAQRGDGDGGDGGTQAQAASPSGAATLHGTILNAITHQPIAHSLVSLDAYGSATLTDNEGRFSFTGLPTGETSLSARHPGYSGDEPNMPETRRTVSITGSSAEATLSLTPQSSISGELILPGNDTPDLMQVQLLRQEIENGRSHWSTYRSVEVSSEGRFRFGNLPSGAYLVHLGASLDPTPAQESANSPKTRFGYVPVFYPGVRERAGAGLLRLTPGQQLEIKLPATREPYYRVSIPTNASGSRNISFNVASESLLGLPARFSPEDGMVHIDLPSGHYRLEGHAYGPNPQTGVREFDVTAGPAQPGAITLLPVNHIPVTVHDERSQPPPTPSEGRPLTAADKVNLSVEPEAGGSFGHGFGAGLQQDRSGPQADHGMLENVSPGRYWITARAFMGYVASMSGGGVDLLANPLVVGADGSSSPIEITLRDDTATLAITLASELKPSTNSALHTPIYVQLIPQSEEGVEQSAVISTDGVMQLSNLPPGSYIALATSSRQQIEYRNPQVLALYAGKTQAVTLPPGGAGHITLDTLADPAGVAPEVAP